MFEKPPNVITLDTIDSLCDLNTSMVSSPLVEKKQIDIVKDLKVETFLIEDTSAIEEPKIVEDTYQPTKKMIDNIKWL